MKIKVNESVEKEIEISFPTFRKAVAHHYKIVSEDTCIQVSDWTLGVSITTVNPTLAYFDEASKDCTESEFLEAYNTVMGKLEILATK